MEDSYLCRSFNYYSNSGICSLLTKDIIDKINTQIIISHNEDSTHYSRQFYEKDGNIIIIIRGIFIGNFNLRDIIL